MKQFNAVLRFEISGYFKSKVYRIMTLLFVLVLMAVLSWPNLKQVISKPDAVPPEQPVTQVEQLTAQGTGENVVALVNQNGALSDEALVLFASAMQGMPLQLTTASEADVRAQVKAGQYAGAVVIQSPEAITYIARNLELNDTTASSAYAAMTAAVRYDAMQALNLPQAEAQAILNPAVNMDVDNLGVSQSETFFYTYIMLMALYMAIMLYGQIVSTSIATEKGSRTMELLITSASPNSLLFGKIIGAGLAGLIQFAAIFGSAVLFYHLNAAAWAGNAIIASIFNMPLPVVGYVLLFFLLGFFLYAFMFGAIGSLVSRVEDVSASSMPVLLVFIIAFITVITAVASGNADNTLMVVCSYIPFTAPMAMFARITMSAPPWYEVILSISILLGTTIGIGMLSASIYRMGVLMYGKPPKPAELLKVIRAARKHTA